MLELMRTTELTDEQWQHLRHLLPLPRKGRGRPRADDRQTLNGILYVLRTVPEIHLLGCSVNKGEREGGICRISHEEVS